MSKYSKAKKVQPGIIIGIISFFVILVALIMILAPSNEQKIFNNYISADATLKHNADFKNHAYKVVTVKQLEKMIDNKEDFVLLVASYTCSVCREGVALYTKHFKSDANKSVLEEHVGKNIYYLDVTNVTQEIYDFIIATNIQKADSSDSTSVSSPHLVLFKDGKLSVSRSTFENNYSNESARTSEFFKRVKAKYA